MQVFRVTDAVTLDTTTAHFEGPVRAAHRVDYHGSTPVGTYHVEFGDKGKTYWHRHSGPQWLFVTEGRVRVQMWNEPAIDLAPGDSVVIEPGEKHWHGAAPGGSGAHLAVNIHATTEWLEPVSESQTR